MSVFFNGVIYSQNEYLILKESKLTPEENSAEESSPEIIKKNKTEDTLNEFNDSHEKVSNQNSSVDKANINSQEQKIEPNNSLFMRFLKNGFDGISSNPNYKMLGLLIILLINLSLFFVIGNIGKTFLRNAGIM